MPGIRNSVPWAGLIGFPTLSTDSQIPKHHCMYCDKILIGNIPLKILFLVLVEKEIDIFLYVILDAFPMNENILDLLLPYEKVMVLS